MKDKLLIVGAGGHGKVCADIAIKMNKWNQVAFLDDNEVTKITMGIEVIGKSSDIIKYINDYDLFVGIGSNSTRQRIQQEIEKFGVSVPVLIHPSAMIGRQVVIGAGTVIMAGVVINCCTTIGKGIIINTSSSIDHDGCIKDYVHISPGVKLAGTVNIGKNTWLGIGSIVSNNINIVEDTIIGAGALVIKDIHESGTYVGVPAIRID